MSLPSASATDLLLSWQHQPAVEVTAALVTAAYFVAFVRARRAGKGAEWPAWRAALFVLGVLTTVTGLESRAASYTLNSMALYMGRLMLLAELAPPLLVLGLPPGLVRVRGSLGGFLRTLLDPWVVFALWTTIIVFWNIPVGFNASLVSATTATLLPVLYLVGGVLVWMVTLNSAPRLREQPVGTRGWFGLVNGLPMMAVAVVWIASPTVLYSPYVGVPCLWNLTPLQNQQISGYVMMIAGLPGMLIALVQIMTWLLRLADRSHDAPAGQVTQVGAVAVERPDARDA